MSFKAMSNYSPNDRAYFQPVIRLIDGKTMTTDDTAIPVLIVGVRFIAGKIMYDIALPDGDGGFYTAIPIRDVDSYFIVKIA